MSPSGGVLSDQGSELAAGPLGVFGQEGEQLVEEVGDPRLVGLDVGSERLSGGILQPNVAVTQRLLQLVVLLQV